jgi:hypothetical protein
MKVLALTSSLPNPGNPSFAAFCGAVGLFIGGLVDRTRRRPRAQEATSDKTGFQLGFGIGFACWVIVVAMDRL